MEPLAIQGSHLAKWETEARRRLAVSGFLLKTLREPRVVLPPLPPPT